MAEKKCDLDGLRELLADEDINLSENLTDPADFLNALHTSLLTRARMAEKVEALAEEEEGHSGGSEYDPDTTPVMMSHGHPFLPARRKRQTQTSEQVQARVNDFFDMLPSGGAKGRTA